MELPVAFNVDTAHLQRLFDNKSECYKLFWFKAIVDSVFEGETVLCYGDLIDRMIADAWYMVAEYKLNLGPNDTLEKIVLYTSSFTGLKSSESKENIISTMKGLRDLEFLKLKKTLTYNVPYRLQAPFISDIEWHKSAKCVAEQINKFADLIYYFKTIDGLNSTIVVQDNWAEYIRANYQILEGWILYDMIEYLQRRNPGVPGIPNKISPPEKRDLTAVHTYWKEIAAVSPILDVYSGNLLSQKDITADHFVPWSYVAHDELWNLCPTIKNINSSKSNNLPNWDRYFKNLSDFEFATYELTSENETLLKLFNKCADKHINSIDVRERLYRPGQSRTEFTETLSGIILPVYTAAQNLGFGEWAYEYA